MLATLVMAASVAFGAVAAADGGPASASPEAPESVPFVLEPGTAPSIRLPYR